MAGPMEKMTTLHSTIHAMGQEHPYLTIGIGSAAAAIVSYKLLRSYMSGGKCTSQAKLQGKTVLITGGSAGIGLETARDMAGRGARVLIACRNISAGNDAAANVRKSTGNGDVEVYQLDLASLKSIRACAKEVLEREERIDILINNAGVMVTPRDAKTEDGFELQMGTNHLGHFLFTNLLLYKIKQSAPARIINVSSSAHDMAVLDLDDILSVKGLSNWNIYGRSKLANILFTNELNKRLKGTGVTTYSLHPGVIKTNLDRHLFAIGRFALSCGSLFGFFKTPIEGAQTSIYCAVQEGIEEQSGKYFSDCAVKATNHPMATDEIAAVKLWATSAKLVGL